ncbi:MAG: glycosyltransferase [Methylobacter sp.]|nr:glycosyltransferase [Methylobacter sp.]
MIQSRQQPGLRVLITNNTLAERTGSELYVYDIALALLKRGYNPIAYSSLLGDVAEELRKVTVPVIDNLSALIVAPDLIHGQHHLDAMTAMLRFPQTPALYFCHGWLPWEELPPLFPSIVRYIAVDDLCRERLLTTAGIAPKKVKILYNFVDLARFKPRSPLPEKPQTALIFSNYAAESNFVGMIRAACLRFGIERIDVAGMSSGHAVSKPEDLLPKYDVVFAKARCALEAMAVGCAVIVADFPGLGGMVTTENMRELRRLNFGVRTMQSASISEENIYAQLTCYEAIDAKKVSEWIRNDADLEKAVDKLEEYYQETLSETDQCLAGPVQTWTSAASDYLFTLAPAIKMRDLTEQRAARADWFYREVQMLTEQNAQLQNQLVAQQNHLATTQDQLKAAQNQLGEIQDQFNAIQFEIEAIRASRTWKAFSGYRKFRKWLSSKSA